MWMDKPKIVCTAASFGYGPISKLLTICEKLNSTFEYELILIGEGISLELAKHTNCFKDIFQYDYNKEPSPEEYRQLKNVVINADLMINVLEPEAVKIANECNLKTIYIDSLIWMWDEIPEILENIECYIAQKNPFNSNTINKIKNLEFCAPIIKTDFKTRRPKEDLLLINFSGLESPFNKFGHNLIYPDILLDNLIEPLNKSSWKEIIVVGNLKVMEYATNKYGDKFRGRFIHLSHDSFLQHLNRAEMIITSPGLTAVYESLYYETSIRFLPPQNYSQALMLDYYKNVSFYDVSMDWSYIYPDYRVNHNLSEHEGVRRVNHVIERFSKDIFVQERAIRLLTKMINDKPMSSTYQNEIFNTKIEDGTSKIVGIISQTIKENKIREELTLS